MKRAVQRGLAAIVCLGVAACAPGDPPPDADRPVVVGVKGDVSGFNLYAARNAFTETVTDLIYPRLAFAMGDALAPGLAESWELDADRRRLVVRLRPDASWSDGTPLTAEDIRFTFAVSSDPQVAWVGAELKERIERVEVLDPATLAFHFDGAYPYAAIDALEGQVLPEHALAEIPRAEWPTRAWTPPRVTGGPFRVADYRPGQRIELERAGGADGRTARTQRIVFRVIPDPTTLVQELVAGGIDVLSGFPVDRLDRVADSEAFRVTRVPDLSYLFVCWNTARPPFDEREVRIALSEAVDREALIEGLMAGAARPAVGPIPSQSWAFDPTLEPRPFDPESARRRLEDAGFVDRDGDGIVERAGVPLRFELDANVESRLRRRIAEVLVDQWRAVGVETVLVRHDFPTYIERHERGAYDAFVGSWRESTRVDLSGVFHSDGGYNYGAFADPSVDAAIEAASAAATLDDARPLWHAAQRAVVDAAPYTFLFEPERIDVVRAELEGFRPSPRSAYSGLEDWRWSDRD